MTVPPTPGEEAIEITSTLAKYVANHVDGMEAILSLQQADYQWRQMEWIGWYFEHAALKVLLSTLGGRSGPILGRTKFDYHRHFVWDFKAHPAQNASGRVANRAVLNDKEAVEECISRNGGVGFIVASGDAEFDQTGVFKAWHDTLKGGISDYEQKRIARDAPSRPRKVSFRIRTYEVLFFTARDQLKRGIEEGWLKHFQSGMRNSDGSPRRPKYMIVTPDVPDWVRPIPPVRVP